MCNLYQKNALVKTKAFKSYFTYKFYAWAQE